MKRIAMAATLSVVASIASAETVWVWPVPYQTKAGDHVPATRNGTVLHPSKPCPLPVVNRDNMRLAEMWVGDRRGKGCFSVTLKNEFVLLYPDGDQKAHPAMIFSAARMEKDGYTVIEPHLSLPIPDASFRLQK